MPDPSKVDWKANVLFLRQLADDLAQRAEENSETATQHEADCLYKIANDIEDEILGDPMGQKMGVNR